MSAWNSTGFSASMPSFISVSDTVPETIFRISASFVLYVPALKCYFRQADCAAQAQLCPAT
jgi:hypothetical protein